MNGVYDEPDPEPHDVLCMICDNLVFDDTAMAYSGEPVCSWDCYHELKEETWRA